MTSEEEQRRTTASAQMRFGKERASGPLGGLAPRTTQAGATERENRQTGIWAPSDPNQTTMPARERTRSASRNSRAQNGERHAEMKSPTKQEKKQPQTEAAQKIDHGGQLKGARHDQATGELKAKRRADGLSQAKQTSGQATEPSEKRNEETSSR